MDKLKILEEIAKNGRCDHIEGCSPCEFCPIGNQCINDTLVIVDCWDFIIGNQENLSQEEVNEAYKKEAIKILMESLIEEVLNEKSK